jgi:hypothetical protein
LRPDQAGVKERQSLRGLILDPMFERRRELALLLGQVSDLEVLERDLLAAIRPHASSDLRAHIDAVGAYNALVIELQGAFDEIRVLSTLNGVKPQDP